MFAAEERGPVPCVRHELPFYLGLVLTLLAVFSVAGGYMAAAVYELGHLSSLTNTPGISAACAVEYQTRILTLNLPLLCGIVGLIAGTGGLTFFTSSYPHTNSFWNTLSSTQGGWDTTVHSPLIHSLITVTTRMQKYHDAGLLEIAGPSGLASLLYPSNYTTIPH